MRMHARPSAARIGSRTLLALCLMSVCACGPGEQDPAPQDDAGARPVSTPAPRTPPSPAPTPSLPSAPDAPEPEDAGETWMSIYKTASGYRFEGATPEAPWSFEVEGESIRTADDNGRMFAKIDEVLVQVMRLSQAQLPGDDKLAAHRRHESDYLERAGLQVAPSSICGPLAIRHEEWLATMPGKSATRYLTVATGDSVLLVAVGNAGPTSSRESVRMLESICGSLAL
jgi:hypothetical protein